MAQLFTISDTALVDLRSARWAPLQDPQLTQLRELLGETVFDTKWREGTLDLIERAGYAGLAPTIFESCLIDPEVVTPGLKCGQQWLAAEIVAFQSELFPVLEELACESSSVAGSLIGVDPRAPKLAIGNNQRAIRARGTLHRATGQE